MRTEQLDLFEWAERQPTAAVLDWCGPFAARVLSRIHEYDDSWPKPCNANNVVHLARRKNEQKRA